MEIGFVGLGRMGLNMVRRLRRRGHAVVAYDRSQDAVREAEKEGAAGATSPKDLCARLAPPRAVWIMVPSGAATESAVDEAAAFLAAGDTILEGGNSNYKDSVRRATTLKARGLHFVDVGTSGGIWGLEMGYCLMIGGDRPVVQRLAPVFDALAPEKGWLHVGANGSGHYVKMIHNGIEYGMMEAYAEGFELLEASGFGLDLAAVAGLWGRGSVVRSWLLELCERALSKDPGLEALEAFVQDSGEGRWTVMEIVEKAIPAPVIVDALLMRFRSRQESSFAARLLAALRQEFGGHAVKKKGT
jgi:6-phosphogluconate dehydrogenase